MSHNEATPYVKMTVRIHKPLLEKLQHELRVLPLRQDAFLDHLISVETPELATQLAGVRQSPKARQFIARELKRLGPKNVSINVRAATQIALNRVVADTNIVRDAFVNRLLILWFSTPQLRAWLKVPDWIEQMPEQPGRIDFRLQTSPLDALKTLMFDPFLYLREGKEWHDIGLYRIPFPGKWRAFNCYIEDYEVPGSAAEKALIRDLSVSAETFAREEREAFGNSEPETKA